MPPSDSGANIAAIIVPMPGRNILRMRITRDSFLLRPLGRAALHMVATAVEGTAGEDDTGRKFFRNQDMARFIFAWKGRDIFFRLQGIQLIYVYTRHLRACCIV